MDQRPGYSKPNPNYGQADNYGNQQTQSRNNLQANPQPTAAKKEISQSTKEKVEAAKAILESQYPSSKPPFTLNRKILST